MKKTIIFDWSGTLSDNFSSFCQVCDLMFLEFGKPSISQEEIRLNFTLPYMKFWNKYFPDLSKDDQCVLYEKFIHQVDEASLYNNVLKTVNDIYKAGWQIIILSSDPYSKLTHETQQSGFSNLLLKVVGNIHDKGIEIKSLIKEFDLDKECTLYVGDTSGDVEAGKFADIKTAGISWGFQHKDVLLKSNPDFLIDDIVELNNILKKI